MSRFLRILSLLSILVPLCLPVSTIQARPVTTSSLQNIPKTSPLSPDSLERPSIIYHDQRQGNDYTHADMTISDGMRLSAMVYSRQEGNRYKVYYQQRPYLDYDLHPSPEVLLADHAIADMSSNAFQYPRIVADDMGNTHVIWVIKDTLYYRVCNSIDDCTINSSWSTPITWQAPVRDCPIFHPSIVSWRTPDGNVRIGISVFVGGSTDKVYVLWKGLDTLWFAAQEVVYSPMVSAVPVLIAREDTIKVIYRTPWSERSLAYKEFSLVSYLFSEEKVLARDDDATFAPANLLREDERGVLFVSSYALAQSSDTLFISYPSTSNHLIFITCTLSCLNGQNPPIDITPQLNATVLHDVRITVTPDGQPILIWKTPDHAIKIAYSFNDRWGSVQTFYTASTHVANLVAIVGKSNVVHIAWTEHGYSYASQTWGSTDHYGQQLQEPVIFIPGTLASALYDVDTNSDVWPYEFVGQDRLTLDPTISDRYQSIIGSYVLKKVQTYTTVDYSWSFRNRYTNYGYVEYNMLPNSSSTRTFDGCDMTQRQNFPNFFSFPYDWRRETDLSVNQLHDYIGCMKRFYPSLKINLIGHSQGALIGRKYLLQHGTHDIRAFIPIGGPWWGTTAGIKGLLGDYLPQVPDKVERVINPTFPALYEMSPSRAFFESGYRPLVEDGIDFDGDGTIRGDITYERFRVGSDLWFFPHHYDIYNVSTHDRVGQDTWDTILENVEFHNIYSLYNDGYTLEQIVLKKICWPNSPTGEQGRCTPENYIYLNGNGDSTVSKFVLEGGSPRGPNAETLVLPTTIYQHSEQLVMPEVQNCVLTVLAHGWCTDRTQPQGLRSQAPLTATTPITDVRFVTLRGMHDIQLTDTQGLTIETNLVTGRTHATSDLQLETMGDSSAMLVVSSDTTATLTLRDFPRSYFALESIKGQSNIAGNELIRFQDVILPTSATMHLTVGITGIDQLRVDANNDGLFERVITPTISISNPAGVDIEPPTIAFTRTLISPTQVAIALSASDPSGVQRIMYSLDGRHFQAYTSTLTLDPRAVVSVDAFAEDTLSNRSSLYQQATTLMALGTPLTITEQTITLPLSVTLDTISSQPITVEYDIERGTATPFEEYTPITGTLTFAPYQTSQSLHLPLLDDLIDEADETLTVTLRYPQNANFTVRQQSITIIDNDTPPTLEFKQPTFESWEEQGRITATLKLSQPSSMPMTVHYHTVDGTATASNDYTARNAHVVIPAHTSEFPITIPLTTNVEWEEIEHFHLVLDDVTNATLGTQTTVTMQILNNKAHGVLNRSFEAEAVGVVPITIHLSSPPPVTATVKYRTSMNDASGWATPNVDYIPISGTVTFAPLQTSQTVSVTLIDDAIPESYEAISIPIESGQHTRFAYYASTTFWITPNDHVSLYLSNLTGYEGSFPVHTWAQLDSYSSTPVSVHYRTIDGSAIAGQDYIAQTGVVTIPAYSFISSYIDIPILQDGIQEDAETFTLELYDPTNAGLGTPIVTTITIPANSAATPTPTATATPLPTSTPLPTNTPTPTATPNPNETLIKRINAGSTADATYSGILWRADQNYSGGTTSNNTAITDILGTNDDILYRRVRVASTDLGNFSYAIPVSANGTYRVRLHFAETYWGATGGGAGGTGKRVFSVNLEGGAVELANYDINADVGPMTAVSKEFLISVSDGTLNIQFTASVNRPIISAIEVWRVNP